MLACQRTPFCAAGSLSSLNKMHVMDEECKLETAAGPVISENAAASAASDGAIDLVIGADRKASIVNSTVASPTARTTVTTTGTKTASNSTAKSNSVPRRARNTTAHATSVPNTITATTSSNCGITPSISAATSNCNSNSNSSSENTAKPVNLKQEVKEELDDDNAGVEKIVETVSVKQFGSPAASRKRPSSDSDSSDRKKPRIPEVEVEELEEEEEWERERSLREAMSAVAGGNGGGGHGGSNEEIELRQLAERLRREIGALAALARAKEHEWNSILRLKKLKEESLVRLQRRRQVLMIEAGVSPENCGPAAVDTDLSNLPVDENMVRGTVSPPSRCSSSGSPPRTTGRGNSGRGSRRTQHQQPTTTGSVAKGNPLMMVPVVSSSPANGQSPRERRNATSSSRPLLPKPMGCNSSPPHGQQQQNTVIREGRKGPILDVRSIIADYRSKNPGDVPRRGRRLRGATSPTCLQEAAGMQLQSTRVSGSGGVLSMASIALGSGSQMRPGPAEVGDIAFLPQTRNEITITPVSANSATKAKEEIMVYEELDDSTDRDRLVIDEGEGEAESVGDVPECQGCHQMAAQFVCAGCGNQWYCSRDCQVAAWDEHSEVCSG